MSDDIKQAVDVERERCASIAVQRVCPKLSLKRQIAVADKVVAAIPKHIRKG